MGPARSPTAVRRPDLPESASWIYMTTGRCGVHHSPPPPLLDPRPLPSSSPAAQLVDGVQLVAGGPADRTDDIEAGAGVQLVADAAAQLDADDLADLAEHPPGSGAAVESSWPSWPTAGRSSMSARRRGAGRQGWAARGARPGRRPGSRWGRAGEAVSPTPARRPGRAGRARAVGGGHAGGRVPDRWAVGVAVGPIVTILKELARGAGEV